MFDLHKLIDKIEDVQKKVYELHPILACLDCDIPAEEVRLGKLNMCKKHLPAYDKTPITTIVGKDYKVPCRKLHQLTSKLVQAHKDFNEL